MISHAWKPFLIDEVEGVIEERNWVSAKDDSTFECVNSNQWWSCCHILIYYFENDISIKIFGYFWMFECNFNIANHLLVLEFFYHITLFCVFRRELLKETKL